MKDQRSFLFLQGMATRFFGKLSHALGNMGYDVHRINFNGGDVLFGPLKGSVSFTQDLAAWPQYLEDRLIEWNVTDIILFGDCRPLHKEAVRLATLRGVRVYVVDEGYIRPNWITVFRAIPTGIATQFRTFPNGIPGCLWSVPSGGARSRTLPITSHRWPYAGASQNIGRIARGTHLSNMADGYASLRASLPRNGERTAGWRGFGPPIGRFISFRCNWTVTRKFATTRLSEGSRHRSTLL
jgi:hypothetical protein